MKVITRITELVEEPLGVKASIYRAAGVFSEDPKLCWIYCQNGLFTFSSCADLSKSKIFDAEELQVFMEEALVTIVLMEKPDE